MNPSVPTAVPSRPMRPVAKVGLVVAGYVAAVVMAFLAVSIYVGLTNGPDRQASGGMFAFGDSLVFLAVFGLAATPATGAALYFLRPRPGFWVMLSIVALIVASTSLAAFIVHVGSLTSDPGSPVPAWTAFATLRVLVAPLCALGFLLSGLFAPSRPARLSLLAAATVEIAVFAFFVVITWVRPFH